MPHRISCPEKKNILFGKGVMETHRLEQGKSSLAHKRRKVGSRLQDAGMHDSVQTRFDHSMLKPQSLEWQKATLPCEANYSPIGFNQFR
jgi:hypothetical protein